MFLIYVYMAYVKTRPQMSRVTTNNQKEKHENYTVYSYQKNNTNRNRWHHANVRQLRSTTKADGESRRRLRMR